MAAVKQQVVVTLGICCPLCVWSDLQQVANSDTLLKTHLLYVYMTLLYLFIYFAFYAHCCHASPLLLPLIYALVLPRDFSVSLASTSPPPPTVISCKAGRQAAARRARTLLVDTKWRVSVLSPSDNIAKNSSWFTFICRIMCRSKCTRCFHIFFLQVLILFDRLFQAIWVGYIPSNSDRNSTLL